MLRNLILLNFYRKIIQMPDLESPAPWQPCLVAGYLEQRDDDRRRGSEKAKQKGGEGAHYHACNPSFKAFIKTGCLPRMLFFSSNSEITWVSRNILYLRSKS